jgi:RimJ/RimL family protein N-acetyltransferase
MELIRTTDLELIKSVFFHPDIKDEVMDGDCELPIQEHVYWLAAYVSGALVGMIVFVPLYGLAWNPHIAILPEHRGCGTEVMRAGVAWMFSQTSCTKILAFPFKPIMHRVYDKCGFHMEGFSRGLVKAQGQIRDCVIVGIENA